jgi:hypothetical protein
MKPPRTVLLTNEHNVVVEVPVVAVFDTIHKIGSLRYEGVSSTVSKVQCCIIYLPYTPITSPIGTSSVDGVTIAAAVVAVVASC